MFLMIIPEHKDNNYQEDDLDDNDEMSAVSKETHDESFMMLFLLQLDLFLLGASSNPFLYNRRNLQSYW